MKTKLTEISNNLNNGLITDYEAKEELLILCNSVKSLKDIQSQNFEKWLKGFKCINCMYHFTDTLYCCRNSMREKYNELGIGIY